MGPCPALDGQHSELSSVFEDFLSPIVLFGHFFFLFVFCVYILFPVLCFCGVCFLEFLFILFACERRVVELGGWEDLGGFMGGAKCDQNILYEKSSINKK